MLSDAHNQIKEDAFQVKDYDLVEKALVQAVESGKRAIALEPGNPAVRPH